MQLLLLPRVVVLGRQSSAVCRAQATCVPRLTAAWLAASHPATYLHVHCLTPSYLPGQVLLDDHCGWVRSLAMAGGRWLFSCACNTLRQVRLLLGFAQAALRRIGERRRLPGSC